MSNTEKINDALNCINQGDYAKAYEQLQPFLKEENATAQYLMGFMYNNGHGVPKDLKKAEELYLTSGKQGVGLSYFYLGAMYFKEMNQPEKAYQSFVEGARLHDKSCIQNGKYMLQNKLGVTVTKEEEARWQLYEAYYDNDMPRLMIDIYYTAGEFTPEFGKEIVTLYYYKAKNENDLRAMFTLACAYKYGKGINQNNEKAIYWLKQLTENNPTHVLAWTSLCDLGEITQEELLEKAKESDDKNFYKEIKKELGIIEEKPENLTLEEELNLIHALYMNLKDEGALQVREFCQKRNNLADLEKLKEELYLVMRELGRRRNSLIAKDIYWLVSLMENVGNTEFRGEKDALKLLHGAHLGNPNWMLIEKLEVKEAEYLYTADDQAEFMDCETYELVTMPCSNIQSYIPYLKEGMIVKLHYLRFGTFAGMTL